ncbi:MAG: choice-of-anchor tandem repeat GloVer-containing protein [Bryobacteraceae bacterium]
MTNRYFWIIFATALSALGSALCAGPEPARANFRVVAPMGQYQQPVGLAEGAPGVFYSIGGGYAFSITSRGTTSQLGAFPNGYNLFLVASASNEQFYGMVAGAGSSVIHAFSVSSKANSLVSYAQQAIYGSLTQNLPDGSLLGTGGDQSTGASYLFSLSTQGNVTPIYQFPGGEELPSNAIYATDGNYYGVSWQEHLGGSTGSGGYVYRVTPAGVLTKLYTLPSGTFSSYGSNFVPILKGTDGNFYGVTTAGGNGYGSVYQLTPSGQFTTLYTFTKGSASFPQSLIQASDGNLYSASLGYHLGGEISRISTSGQYTPMHYMGGNDGQCQCLIVQGSDGVIYGTAIQGGGAGGTVFALNAGLPKPVPQALEFGPQQGLAGTRVRIWGSNMLQATVEFNGVPATTVSNSGPNYVWATVPHGATSGPITVSTPGGTSTTQASFTVE